MSKSRDFSIYLLKTQFTSENSLKNGHGLEKIEEVNTNLPAHAVMYVADTPGSAPWWKSYWGITKELYQVQKGAIIFLLINDRWVVLTFGMTHHRLKDNSYEYDFGLRTTLNALDPNKIKSTDILQPENAKRQRIQSSTASSLTFFDIRHDESIIKKLTGAVKTEYINFFKNATGASSLRISSKLLPDQIVDLCETLIEIYEKTDYVQTFPDIQNIVPVKDPDRRRILDEKLVEAFNAAPVELVLSIPEIIDYSTSFRIKYIGAGRDNKEYNDVFIADYRGYLQDRGVTDYIEDVTLFHRHKLAVIDENGVTIKEYRIYSSFLFDCEVAGKTYHLCDGEWYLIETNYVEKLCNSLDPYFVNDHEFLSECNVVKESDYNLSIKEANDSVHCLDRTSISPVGQTQVEPCDLISIVNGRVHMVHVKISTRSSNLSHLFNQGINSIQLLRMEAESREKLKHLLGNDVVFDDLIDKGLLSVTYGIITKKDRSSRSKNLPIFSRISLLRAVNALRLMGIPCAIYFIHDNIDRKNFSAGDET